MTVLNQRFRMRVTMKVMAQLLKKQVSQKKNKVTKRA